MRKKECQPESMQQVQRLCSEIQLFDLCDLERCNFKNGRFCAKSELLARFEHIADVDECSTVRNNYDEFDENEEDDADDVSLHEEDGWED